MRVKLRAFESKDSGLLVEYLNRDQVVHFLSSVIPQPYTKADANWWITVGSKENIVSAVELDGVLCGCVGAHRQAHEHARSAELGYWFAESFWGKGIATQALQAFIPKVFATTDIVRLQATVFDGNDASLRVLQKLGFEKEGLMKKAVFKNSRFYDAYLFAKVSSE